MRVTTSYTVWIKNQLEDGSIRPVDGRVMKQTSVLCLEALKLCAGIFLSEWGYLSALPAGQKAGAISRRRGADLLIHSTKANRARYPVFDARFPYMPAYTRRAIIADALGMVGSYVSNHAAWEALPSSDRGAEPVMGYPSRYELTFYDQERDLGDLEKGVISLKLYDGKGWNWYSFSIAPSDAKYISGLKASRKMLSPVVEKVKNRYRIRFAFEEEKNLAPCGDPLSHSILAVDLGINAPASWCIMEAGGSVRARGVIRLRRDEDRLRRLVNRKRMYQKAGKKAKNIYRMVTAANRQLSIDTSRELVRIAAMYNAGCIVFEHLDRKGHSYSERIHMWRAVDVQKRVELQAHRQGMRISRVCAWNTSGLAFDGSGTVIRGKSAGFATYSLCRFPNGKVYNCDLSAALNIGARYFLREYAKTGSYPDLPKTPQRTYAVLRSLTGKTRAAA